MVSDGEEEAATGWPEVAAEPRLLLRKLPIKDWEEFAIKPVLAVWVAMGRGEEKYLVA